MSEVKVNKISPRSGTTVTLGDSGDTFTIPSGATINNQGTATNFGATGSASWVTTVKTSTFTAVAGEGYFVNTTGGAVTVNLPAGTAGAVVAIKDYAGTFDTNAVTLVQNGSDKIGGSTGNSIIGTEGIAVTLVFIDSTQGWLVTDSGLQSEAPEPAFIQATGGTVTTVCTNFKVHTFTGPGTFAVTNAGNSGGSNEVSYAVVAGGGGGGNWYYGGAGGAGGYREGKTPQCSYTSSPVTCTSGSNNGVAVTAQCYSITVGGGGAAPGSPPAPGGAGAQGSTSTFSVISSAGGGGGGARPGNTGCGPGGNGGSGGGGTGGPGPSGQKAGGTGNTPPVSPAQGTDGGEGSPGSQAPQGGLGGSGGGATAAGTQPSTNGTAPAAAGGAGATSSINGTPTARAGGGGGGGNACGSLSGGAGGAGGGGNGVGGGNSSPIPIAGTTGTANTGGGGGGGGHPCQGGCVSGKAGGSGIVIIRYKFQ